MMFTSAAQAQFDLEEYLKRKDVNRNGRVEPEELSSNARGILRKMGFDDNKSNSISKVVSKANKDRAVAASKSKSSTSRDRKVPGFGVEGKTESEGVSRFGASGDSGSSRTKTKFSDSVIERVESTMKQYDRNKNGVLDKSEISSARWGSPSPDQNDTNRDGRLSKEELSHRYASREKQYGDRSRSSTDRSRTSGTDRSRTSSSDRKSSESRFRTTRSSSSPSSSSSSSKSGSSGSDDQAARAKYERYAESLVTQYDADKDGKLSKDETKKMRRPPAGADIDKDGFITKDELVGSLSGTNKKSTSSSSKVAVKESSSRSRGRESTRGSSGSSSKYSSSSSFDKLDGNADKQVQMHEFASKWDDKTVDEFYEKDRNGDGVITLQEWSGK